MEQKNSETLITKTTLPAQAVWTNTIQGGTGEHTSTLAELRLTCWKRRFVITVFTASVLLLAIIYILWKTPVYESMAQIQVAPNQSGSLGLDQLIYSKRNTGSDDENLQSQVKIIQSDTVSLQVIKDLDLAHNKAFVGKKLFGKIEQSDPMKMYPRDRDALLKLFTDAENVVSVPKTQLIQITFRSINPQLATDGVNAILDAHMLHNFQMRYEGTQQVAQWLGKQIQELRTDAADAQRRLVDFQKQNNILVTGENNNIVTDRLAQLNTQVTDAEAARILKEARYRLASTGNPELVAAVVPSVSLQVLRTQEAELKAQLAQLEAKFGSGYPKIRESQAQLKRLDKAISEEVKNIEQRLHDEFLASADSEKMLRGNFENQKQETFKLYENGVEYATLKHEVESSQNLYDALQLKLREAGIAAGLASANINIVDRGRIPSTAVLPKKLLVLALALFGGLFGGVGMAFILESLDDTIQTSEDVESTSSLPALAVVPWAGSRGFRNVVRRQLPAPNVALVSINLPNSPMSEAYRAACSSLLLSSVDSAACLLVVVSALPQEGKSVTSCNLSIALAKRGGKVLLIDGDLRRSSLHKTFDLTNTEGLSSMLAGKVGDEAIQYPLAELPNLAVLPSGPHSPSPTEVLASNRLGTFVEKWTAEYDHVIFDTAPLIPVADTMALAARADAVILVVRSGMSRKRALSRMRDLLHRANAHIAGVIINSANMQLEHYYSYRYGYRYGYGYGSYDAETTEEANEKS